MLLNLIRGAGKGKEVLYLPIIPQTNTNEKTKPCHHYK